MNSSCITYEQYEGAVVVVVVVFVVAVFVVVVVAVAFPHSNAQEMMKMVTRAILVGGILSNFSHCHCAAILTHSTQNTSCSVTSGPS